MPRRTLLFWLVLAAALVAASPLRSAFAVHDDRTAAQAPQRVSDFNSGRMPDPWDQAADTPAPPPPTTHEVLAGAARQEGIDPNLFLAVAFWESGWHQDRVSSEGAIGLLQVMPKTAALAGPSLLGRPVDLANPSDNALMGAALLKDLLVKYGTRTGLAAYYQGEPALLGGRYAADTWSYADGIIGLAGEIAAGRGPAETA